MLLLLKLGCKNQTDRRTNRQGHNRSFLVEEDGERQPYYNSGYKSKFFRGLLINHHALIAKFE